MDMEIKNLNMLRYKAYINESREESSFEEGENVLFTSSRSYYKNFDGQIGNINHAYGDDEYQLLMPGGAVITALGKEIKRVDKSSKTTADHIENQFPREDDTPKSNKLSIGTDENGKMKIVNNQISLFPPPETKKEEKFKKGQRVVVNGQVGRINFKNRKGTIVNVGEDIQVEFDDDDSRNLSRITMMIEREFVTPLNEPDRVIIGVGDKIECIDNTSQFNKEKGHVSRVWPDGDVMCEYPNKNSSIVMKPHQIKVTEPAKPGEFKKTEVSKPSTSVPITTANKTEEEEDDDDVAIVRKETFKKADLMEFSYEDFFDKEKTITKDEMLVNKQKYQEAVDKKEGNELKLIFMDKALRTAELVEQYFDFLIAKVAKDLPVYRTVEVIENEDLLATKTKVRASESKEITKKYSFDQGIIAYWKFKDAVVFKTI